MKIESITIVDSEGKIWTAAGTVFTLVELPETEDLSTVAPEVTPEV